MEARLRICFVPSAFAPFVGGAEGRVEKLARRLQAVGHDVLIVTPRHRRDWRSEEMLDGLPVVRVGGFYKRGGVLRSGRLGHIPIDLALFQALWRMRDRYDVLHAFEISPLAATTALVGRLSQKPTLISTVGTGPNETQLRLLERRGAVLLSDTLPQMQGMEVAFDDWAAGAGDVTYFSRLALGGRTILHALRASRHITYQVASARGQTYLTANGFRTEQIVRIPTGVDTERFCPMPLPLCLADDQPERTIVCVARLEYPKGIDVLLHAWGRMLRAPAGWRAGLRPRLRLVGAGKLQEQLERIAAALGIAESVEFAGASKDTVACLHAAWGFVMPSRWEGMPNALLEAMACGLPCVATRVSGSEDVIADGVNGLLVEPERPAELAHALRRIIGDSALAQRLGREGRATMLKDYQLRDTTDRFVDLYRRLLVTERRSGADGESAYRQDRSLEGVRGR